MSTARKNIYHCEWNTNVLTLNYVNSPFQKSEFYNWKIVLGAAPTPEPEITTYSPPIDFDLGTTASAGIEVEDVQYEEPELEVVETDVQYEDVELGVEETIITEPSNSVDAGLTEPTLRIAADEASYEEEYNVEDESDYEPAGGDIPIQVEEVQGEKVEDLPGYEPLVLLVGTPEQAGY